MGENNGSSIIADHMHSMPPDQFVTLSLLKQALGPKFKEWQNAVDECPREIRMRKLVKVLLPLVQDDTEISDEDAAESIRNAMQCIQGENYSHYERPDTDVLGNGAWSKLNTLLSNNRDDNDLVVLLERYTQAAIKEVADAEQFNKLFDPDSDNTFDLIPGDKNALCLYKTNEGARFIVCASFFVIFAPNQRKQARINRQHSQLHASCSWHTC